MSLKERLLSFEAGDPISYSVLEEIEQDENLNVETVNYYHDSVGFVEGWRIGKNGEIVVSTMCGSNPIVRTTDHLEDELQ
jgi:hypothetical protein